jgi:hypothetical protein
MCKILGFHGNKMPVLLLTGIVTSIYISLQTAAPALFFILPLGVTFNFLLQWQSLSKTLHYSQSYIFHFHLGSDSFKWCIWQENEKNM